MKKALVALLVIFGSLTSYASHIPGGNLTYQCTGNPNEYIITMTLFVSCPSTLGSQYSVTASNNCGLANPTISLPQLGVQQEVSQICPGQQSQSDCPPGTGGIPGVLMYTYQATVTLPAGCNSWTFSFELCCRDASTNTNGGSGNSMYFQTIMNSNTAPCDGSPFVTAQPIPYVCAGQSQSYCPGAIDPDGDSLYYSLINPYGAGAVSITHPAPYTPTAPLQNFTFDPTTGCITFNQPTTGNFVVTYLIEAFDAAGNMTGSIVHDFQFEVISCSNVTPDPPAGGITLISGNATQLGPNLIELCEGATACFSMTFTDPDPADILTIDTATSNIFAVFPGATITTTGTNPFTVDICWTVPAGAQSQLVATLTVKDGACPIEGTATQVAVFDVINSTVANPDTTICGPQQAQLSAAGGSVFNWTSIAGDPIIVGVNFSCNPCANPIATPSQTTTYMVSSNLSGGCNNNDTVTVFVAPDWTLTTFGDTLLCDFLPAQIGANVSPFAAGYTAVWSPAATLSSGSILSPIANPQETTTYSAWVTSPQGCTKFDSVVVTVNPPPGVTLIPGDTTICQGDQLQFDVSLTALEEDFNTGAWDPAVWSNVSGATVGTPCVPHNGDALLFDSGNRSLITNSLAVSNCTSIDFCLWMGNSLSTGVTGCENADLNEDVQLSYSINGGATWVPIQVFPSGDWDAAGPYPNTWACLSISIPAPAQTANTMFQWEQIGSYGATIDNWALDDISLNCGGNANYTYSWTPPTGLSATNVNDPFAAPQVTTTYTVTLTDTGGCSVDRSQTITVVSNYTLTSTQSDTNICLGETVNFNVTPSTGSGYSYSWSPAGIMNDSTIANPTATFNTAGTNMVVVTVDNGGGCTKTDTFYVNVSQSYSPTIDILANDTLIGCSDTVDMAGPWGAGGLDLGGGIPTSCGPSPTNSCSGASTQTSVGTPTGANTTTSWPAPYGNWYRNAKHQFLYTAAELNAMGIFGGKITEIAWEVTQINGTTTYFSYQISMGCTPTTSLNAWETGLTQVLNPVTVNVVVGMNAHPLDVAYEWDGVSNLVVEICYDNLAVAYTQNCTTPWTTTTFNSSLYYRSDVTPACPATTFTTSTNRPVTRFTHCPTTPDPNIYYYSWSPNYNISDTTVQNPYMYPTQTTTYVVTVTDTLGGCFDIDSVTITVNNPLNPSISITDVSCNGMNDGVIVANSGAPTGIDLIEFYDSTGVTLLQSTQGQVLDSITNIGSGSYFVMITDSSGCTWDTIVTVNENAQILLTNVMPDSTICINGSATLYASSSGGTAPVDIIWDAGAFTGSNYTVNTTVSPTTYYVFAQDASGCISQTDSVIISLFDTLSVPTVTAGRDTICPNDTTYLSVAATTGGMGAPYNYDWYDGGGNPIGTGLSIVVTPSMNGEIYSCVITDGCTTPSVTVYYTIYWSPIPVPSFTVSDATGCYPITVTVVNTTNGVTNNLWNWGDGSADDVFGQSGTHTYNSPGQYDITLTVTNTTGCSMDTTITNAAYAYPYPTADFTMDPQPTNYTNPYINFTNQSYSAPLLYAWNFTMGSPGSSSEENPRVEFPGDSSGTYPVSLVVTNQFGCTDSMYNEVIIDGLYLFYIPNSFSPFDGNGINDTFKPYGDGIDLTSYSMQIYDRWGELLFESNEMDRGWDGTYKGKLVPTGVYIWKITTKELEQNKHHEHYGNVTITH